MDKKSPIAVVGKKQERVGKTRSSGKRRNKNVSKKKTTSSMPQWLFHLSLVLFALLLSTGFYFFFIRPYAYRWKTCMSVRAYGVCMPYGYPIHGIDVSHFQNHIDWELLKRAQSPELPLKFVFIKATEGGDLADERFAYNIAEARKNGFITGAYHFFNPSTPPEKQAEFFIQTVKLQKGDLPPVLDVELKGKNGPEKLKADVRTWLTIVERHYGVRPILYTGYKFKMKYLSDDFFNQYPYWIAHYYIDSVRYEGQWHFWQHTDVGRLPGIREDVDLNVFNGSLEDLYNMTIH